jgi:FkbM family methyltransferase
MDDTRHRMRWRRVARKCLDAFSCAGFGGLLRKRRIVRLSTGAGAGLRFSPGPSVAPFGGGSIERPVQDALEGLLRPGSVFFDVGANVGFLTLIGAKLVGDRGVVYAFEPVPANTAALRRNVRLNGFANVILIEKAISSAPGREKLILAVDSGGAALAVADRPPDEAGAMDVEVTSIDALIQDGQARPPAVVKVDVEGAEIQVLQGMAATLDRCRPAVLYELDGPDESCVEKKSDQCRAFLVSHGYQISRLEDSYPDNRWRVRHYLARHGGESGGGRSDLSRSAG